MSDFGPEHFINRETSWLEFNQRVLDEAVNPENPLLERVKFFCIVSSNLDEFFEVRVAGLKQQIEGEVTVPGADGRTASETLEAITKRVRRMVDDLYTCWRKELIPLLAKNHIRFLDIDKLDKGDLEWVRTFYMTEVHPVLTPMAIDPAHPFPQLLNKSLNMIVQLEAKLADQPLRHLVVVQVPRVIPRLVRLPRDDGRMDYVTLGSLIGHFMGDLLPGTKVLGCWHFRVTRNSELYIDEDDMPSLLKAVEEELHNRRKGAAVRLEVDHDCPGKIVNALLSTMRLDESDVYWINGPLNPTRFMQICSGDHSPELRYRPFVPAPGPVFESKPNIFEAIRKRDILLHHPYESFNAVVELLEAAADDPDVLAIKQTLYRTGGDERIIGALQRAVHNGKQVTAVVELRARFDEANNIEWARKLEEAGVQVVYGMVGYKIHCKALLVVRREGDRIRRYVHLGTGNYNPSTARLYTDLSMFTARAAYGEDATNLFNLLTGICQYQGMRTLLVAPFDLHTKIIKRIEAEEKNAREGLPSRIIAKMNSLVDRDVIKALYRASQAGVKIDLIIRGICCLRPGIKGVSEHIHVRSIVDRYLEHSRIFYFENSCQPVVLVGSADWMPRNFHRRIEVVFPVVDGILRDRIMNEILPLHLADNARASVLHADATYRRVKAGNRKPCRSQFEFMNTAEATLRRGPKPPTAKKGAYPKMKLAPKPE